MDGCHGFMLEGSGSCFSRNRIGKRSFLGYLRVRSSQTHLINQWLERVCTCKQTVNRRHVRLRKHPFLLARDIWEWNFCPLMRTFVSFINKRQSCFTHVQVQCLSPHENIYNSTHAHYDTIICTCLLLINESSVVRSP